MIIDHTGYYFFPDDLWWRAIGRLSAPVWLFLIGFARSRDLSPRLWAGAGILILASFACGDGIFPVNILVTILLIRIFIDRIAVYMLSEKQRMIAVAVLLFAAAIPTGIFMDYGSIGLIVALYGYLVRQRTEGRPVKAERIFAAYACFSYFFFAFIAYGFAPAQSQFVMFGETLLFTLLYYFRPMVFTPHAPVVFPDILRFVGRHTLEIYVIHLLLFKFMAAWLGLEGRQFFSLVLFM
jgi:hypothetical protein